MAASSPGAAVEDDSADAPPDGARPGSDGSDTSLLASLMLSTPSEKPAFIICPMRPSLAPAERNASDGCKRGPVSSALDPPLPKLPILRPLNSPRPSRKPLPMLPIFMSVSPDKPPPRRRLGIDMPVDAGARPPPAPPPRPLAAASSSTAAASGRFMPFRSHTCLSSLMPASGSSARNMSPTASCGAWMTLSSASARFISRATSLP